jgi:hypothetical protein
MALRSKLFRDSAKLQACLVYDHAHVTPNSRGDHVQRIQRALMLLDGANISRHEMEEMRYGPSAADAVLTYKTARNIVNRSYQTQADNIVGKMTIAAMDNELLMSDQGTTIEAVAIRCEFGQAPGSTS